MYRINDRVKVIRHYGGVTRNIGSAGAVLAIETCKPSNGIGIGARETHSYLIRFDSGHNAGYDLWYWEGELTLATSDV